MQEDIIIVPGPCAAESRKQIMGNAYNISQIRDIVSPYGINFGLRGGAWKPRTNYFNGKNGDKVFEGEGVDALKWLAEAAEKYGLPIVTELMSEQDTRHFRRYLDSNRDFIQIGTRTSQSFALLYEAGGENFGVVLKNPQHGVDVKEAQGSIERFHKNREIIYCVRGQKKFIYPDGSDSGIHKEYVDNILNSKDQHPDSRNFNNIGAISILREKLAKNVKFWYDPSHTFGGKTHEMRRMIGEYAIKAITEFGYNGIIVEVDDRSKDRKCDKEQALLTTTNGVDWSKTHVGEAPTEDQMPITLVDIVSKIMDYRVEAGANPDDVSAAKEKLRAIRWGDNQIVKAVGEGNT